MFSAASFASAQQLSELTYNEEQNILNVNQTPYQLLGEPDLLWGDVVRRQYVPTTRSYIPRPMVINGRTITVVIDQYGLQADQHFVNFGKANEYGISLETYQLYGITTMEMTPQGTIFTAEFTFPSEGTWHVWYTGLDGVSGIEEFIVE